MNCDFGLGSAMHDCIAILKGSLVHDCLKLVEVMCSV